MSKKHQKVLSAIFSDHPSSNIHWHEVESLLIHLGAQIREGKGASVVFIINGNEFTLHRGHHSATMSKPSLHQLKRDLESSGIDLN